MKYLSIVFATLMLLGFSSAEMTAQKADRDQFEVQVDGLGCPFCAYGLEKKVKKLKGVKKLTIDMETGLLGFTYPTEKALSVEAIQDQVSDAGYTPISVKITRADGTVEKSKEIVKTFSEDMLVDAEFMVAGKCDMCKSRVELAAMRMEGVSEATWDEETQMMKVKYDSSKHSEDDVMKAMAKVGHDTEKYQSKDITYKNLPGCCKYKRIEQ